MAELQSSHFYLKLHVKVFEADISFPSNTILSVWLKSYGFSAEAEMDVDIKALIRCTENLQQMYQSLSGKAEIAEPFDCDTKIVFEMTKTGHVQISGELSDTPNGAFHNLRFEHEIDQTEIYSFFRELQEEIAPYLDKKPYI